MPEDDAWKLTEWLSSKGFVRSHPEPRREMDALTSWTQSNKHIRLTDDDRRFFKRYVAIALAAGTPLSAEGIFISGHGYVHLDKAKINSLINHNLIVLNESTKCFELTEQGLRELNMWDL